MEVRGLVPIPESDAALDEYISYGDGDARASLMRLGSAAQSIVPELVGLSLTVFDEDLTFTLVAPPGSDPGVPADLGAPSRDVRVESDPPVLDEGRWRALASASAAAGVASTLTLPVEVGASPRLGVSLYASRPESFAGRHGELAAALGGSVDDIVTNADLSFSTRVHARQAPHRLAEQLQEDIAVGLLAALQAVDVDEARAILRGIATRAGVTVVQAARVLRQMWRYL